MITRAKTAGRREKIALCTMSAYGALAGAWVTAERVSSAVTCEHRNGRCWPTASERKPWTNNRPDLALQHVLHDAS